MRDVESMLDQNGSCSRSIIPPLIIYTIVVYYWIKEYFDDVNEDVISLSDDKMSLISKSDDWDNTSFGKVRIDSISDNIYKWKLRITDDHEDSAKSIYVVFGISSGSDTKQVFLWENATVYAYNVSNGFKYNSADLDSSHYGKQCKGGDTVGINLDLYKKKYHSMLMM